MAKFVGTQPEKTQDEIEKERFARYTSVLNALRDDKVKPDDRQKYSNLHFLLTGVSTNNPEEWVSGAFWLFDHKLSKMLPKDAAEKVGQSPVRICKLVKDYRKELQKFRKEHGGVTPQEADMRQMLAQCTA